MLHLAPGRGDVGVPALRHLAARELDRALVERRLELQEEDGLLDVEDLGHEPSTVAGMEPWIDWVRRLQAIAETGLEYASDPYDVKRYEEVARLASEVAGEGTGLDRPRRRAPDPEGRRARRGVREGTVLLVREVADGRWTLPGGWADIGQPRPSAPSARPSRNPACRARRQARGRPRPRGTTSAARAPHLQAVLPLRDHGRRAPASPKEATRSRCSRRTSCRRSRPAARCAGRSSSRSRTRRGPTCPRPSTS